MSVGTLGREVRLEPWVAAVELGYCPGRWRSWLSVREGVDSDAGSGLSSGEWMEIVDQELLIEMGSSSWLVSLGD